MTSSDYREAKLPRSAEQAVGVSVIALMNRNGRCVHALACLRVRRVRWSKPQALRVCDRCCCVCVVAWQARPATRRCWHSISKTFLVYDTMYRNGTAQIYIFQDTFACRRFVQAYDLAKKQGYVVLRGTGYRRERKGSPLQNIFRQFCDAKAMPCTSVLTGQGSDAVDEVEIDFSPLRVSREVTDSLSEQADAVAAELEAPRVELELGMEGAKEEGAVTVGLRTVVIFLARCS